MKKILIVEDNHSERKITVDLLKGGNFEIQESSTGTDGFNLLSKNKYDLVILDYHLPGMSGIDMLRTLEEKGTKVMCPVIMLTAEAETPGSEVKQLNVVNWAIKPLHGAKFLELVEQVIKFYDKKK